MTANIVAEKGYIFIANNERFGYNKGAIGKSA
jgi:hypothetical protein